MNKHRERVDKAALPVDIHDLNVHYGSVHAVRGVNLSVDTGRICGIVGMNGSGKSTTFKAIMGLVPYDGEILIKGLHSLSARKSGLIGYVPQSEDIDHDFPISVEEVVMTGRYGFMNFIRHPRAVDRQAVSEALEKVGLSSLRKRPIGALSGGQRKRVFVGRAIAQGAELMILDEPFAGVDVTSQDVIIELLRELAAEGRTLLVSTHDLDSLPRLCDEVALINRKIIFHGSVAEATEPDRLAQAFQEN